MLTVAARIPDAAARDQFADRIAHKARVTEDVVRAEIRKAAVQRKTELAPRNAPSFGQLKDAERGLIWTLIHNSQEALGALADLHDEDLSYLAAREVFEAVRALKDLDPARLPTTLLQRLSTMNAQLVTSIAATPAPVAPARECARALKRLCWERERATIQRQIDQLQERGSGDREIDALLSRKNQLAQRIEQLT
jgi:hypothetical protein